MKGRYTDQYKQIHQSIVYGDGPCKRTEQALSDAIDILNPDSILDYGCGQTHREDKFTGVDRYVGYDPAIPGKDVFPDGSFALCICTDVLEHIPIDELGNNLKMISDASSDAVFLVCCRPADAILPSGENAHCTVESPEWWVDHLKPYFPAAKLTKTLRWQRAIIDTIQGNDEIQVPSDFYKKRRRNRRR